jgi:thiol:disulfide interchange protein
LQELWVEITSDEDLASAQVSLPPGKLLVVDYYAGWCAVCKTAYTALCKIAHDKHMKQHFVFAKVRGLATNRGIYTCSNVL